MPDIEDAVWDKIQALRSLIDPSRGATPHEIEIATVKVQNLLLEYNLDMATLELGKKPTTRVTHEFMTMDKDAVIWEMALLKTLADHNFCRVIGDETRRVFALIGKPLNIQATWETYLWLTPKMADTATRARENESKLIIPPGDWFEDSDSHYMAQHSPLRWSNSYLSGMVLGIETSLKRSRWDALDTSEKRALVPVMDKEVDDYLKEHFKVENQKNYSTSDQDVFMKGKSAGLTMDTMKREEIP